MNTTAFAEEVAVDSTDEAAVTVDEVAVDTYETIGGQPHKYDTIDPDDYSQVPDSWGINADPKGWSLADGTVPTKIVSTDNVYYSGQDERIWKPRIIFIDEDNYDHDLSDWYLLKTEWDAMSGAEQTQYEDDLKNTEGVVNLSHAEDSIAVDIPASNWTVYTPVSYFFNPVDVHLVDGRVVVPTEGDEDINGDVHQNAVKSNNESVIYRVIPAGENTYVLVKVTGNFNLGKNVVVNRSSVDGKNRVEGENVNTRYKGDEPVVTFRGLKHVNTTYDKKTGAEIQKKGEHNTFDVDAVLIKHETGKNTLIKGLSVKKVNFKNNVNASFPEEYRVEPDDTWDDASGGVSYRNGYKITMDKTGKKTGVEVVGGQYASQLTKTENANFKGQPSFQVSFEVKGDAKAYSKDVKKAEKAKKPNNDKETMTTFNFEIAQLNIGNWTNDKISTSVTVEGKADNETKADEAIAAKLKAYIDEYAAAILNDNERYPSITKKAAAEALATAMITYDGDNGWNNEKKTYSATIEFDDVPMYVNKEIDAKGVSENNVPSTSVRLGVKKDDVKNLKFKKGKTSENSVTGKLWLETTEQNIFAHNGSYYKYGDNEPDTDRQVGTITNSFAYVKTTSKAGGKADVVLTASSVTDPVFGEIPFAIAKGQNDLTGAMTMRIVEDAHGDQSLQYGHYKDADHFTVESIDE